MRNKPLSRTEMKILVFNKMKNKGLNYDQAVKEVTKEVEELKSINHGKKNNN